MLERYYADTGFEIQGPCELRQSWKYNDLTPRTYFAQGGQAYHDSKYIRDIANSLANSFTETHFLSRFSLHDIVLTPDDDAFIYDYTSFTSKLAELKYFLDALADWTDDVEVKIVDSRFGILNTTLGSLIREYNQTCNTLGEYTIQRYLEGDLTIYFHRLAGFLGVYGNIVLSTAIHGLHATQLNGDHSSAKCVGDDVFGRFDTTMGSTRREMIERIQKLGLVHHLKVRWWPFRPIEEEMDDDRAWPYVKRPLDRFQNRMIHDSALFLPIFGLIHPIPDGIHDEAEDVWSRTKLLACQTLALIKQVRNLFPPIDGIQEELLRRYLCCLYRAVGCQEKGFLPFESIRLKTGIYVTGLLMPNITGEFVTANHWDLLHERWDNRRDVLVRVPAVVDEGTSSFRELLANKEVESIEMDRRLAYLERLSWVETSANYVHRYFDFEGYRKFYESMFDGNLRVTYQARLAVDAPEWISDLLLI